MAVVVLIIIGIVVWMVFRSSRSEPRKQHIIAKARLDKEFEDMYFNGASENDIDDIRSSLFLEDAASEFDVQGLELDWTCIVWDGDLRRENDSWGNYSFTGNKWQNIRSEERKSYQINAYRVLLTRARQGMIICVPEGNPEDGTRNSKYYDGTFDYLKNIGLEVT